MADHDHTESRTHSQELGIDWQLQRIYERYGHNFDSAIRDAFLMLEDRIRNATGLPQDSYGIDLITAAFNPSSGILVNPLTAGAERRGTFDLFAGAFLSYRNPVAHRAVNHDETATRRVFHLLDLLLVTLETAVENQIEIEKYVSRHEGQIGQHRRFYRLDIDGDDIEERVVLLDVGSVIRRDGAISSGSLLTLVLKPDDDGYRRIPTETVSGLFSMYGPVSVDLMRLTDSVRKDLVVQWTFGESQTGYFILKWDGEKYVHVRRDSNDYREPYASFGDAGFMTHPTWQSVQFVDHDGDGFMEIVHTLGNDPFNPDGTGWPIQGDHRVPQISRVFKYESGIGRFCLTEEVGILG